MRLREKTLTIDIDDPKQIYEWRRQNCVLFMKNKGHRNVFEKYCEFYDLKPTAELNVRFRYFWAGRTRDEVMLEKYEKLVNHLEKNTNEN